MTRTEPSFGGRQAETASAARLLCVEAIDMDESLESNADDLDEDEEEGEYEDDDEFDDDEFEDEEDEDWEDEFDEDDEVGDEDE